MADKVGKQLKVLMARVLPQEGATKSKGFKKLRPGLKIREKKFFNAE